MKEIDIQLATHEVESLSFEPLEEYWDLYEGRDGRSQKALHYMLDFFINTLKFQNVRRFAEVATENQDRCENDFSVIAPHVDRRTKIVDIGCGWGSYTKLLSQKAGTVYAVDHVLQHTVVTKYLSPNARVYQGDAKELAFESGEFDITVAKDLIEHVGDPTEPWGASGRNLLHQFKLMGELARITKLGGFVYLSTGNYLFPKDGENGLWFYHWLDIEDKEAYNRKKGISSDKYWLLTWDELHFLLRSAGLAVEKIVNFDSPVWEITFLKRLRLGFSGLDSDTVDIWRQHIKTDPRYCSSWLLLARKVRNEVQPRIEWSNRCYYSRATGACCGTPERFSEFDPCARDSSESEKTSPYEMLDQRTCDVRVEDRGRFSDLFKSMFKARARRMKMQWVRKSRALRRIAVGFFVRNP